MVNNAIDAIGNNGKIALNAVQDEKNVTLTIADNGSGIDIEYLDKIFIPFFTTKQHGSGIGLTLSRQLLYNNRASVSVKSELGKGTVFIIKFWR
jgi:signal transduction histidine kinase